MVERRTVILSILLVFIVIGSIYSFDPSLFAPRPPTPPVVSTTTATLTTTSISVQTTTTTHTSIICCITTTQVSGTVTVTATATTTATVTASTSPSTTTTTTTTSSTTKVPPALAFKFAASGNSQGSLTATVNIAAGNILLVGFQQGSSAGTPTIKDTGGNTWTLVKAINADGGWDAVWLATAQATASDVITITQGQTTFGAVEVYLVSGASNLYTEIDTSANTGSPSVSSTSFQSGAFVAGFVGGCSTITAGSGFTLLQDSGQPKFASEYATGVTSPSTVPFTMSSGCWEEIAVVLPPA